MQNEEYNNDYYGFTGYINRKNYIINMSILITVGIVCKLINVEALFKYSSFKILIPVLDFAIAMVIFVVMFACISLVYRRLADITANSPQKTKDTVQLLFKIFYVFPVLYLFCIRYFIGSVPFISGITDIVTLFFMLPAAVLAGIFIAVYNGKR